MRSGPSSSPWRRVLSCTSSSRWSGSSTRRSGWRARSRASCAASCSCSPRVSWFPCNPRFTLPEPIPETFYGVPSFAARHAEAAIPRDPRDPSPPGPDAGARRDADRDVLHVPAAGRPPGRGVHPRDRTEGILHPVGEPDRRGPRGHRREARGRHPGAGDGVGGVAVTRTRPLFEKLWYTYKLLGPAIGPFEAFLVRRGIKTLPLRVHRQNRSATALAEHLEGHPAVAKVHYPGLRSFAQYRLARRQMEGFGGMLSIELKGGYRAGLRFVESVRLATLAVSLGGAETLVEHPASMTHGTLSAKERALMGIGDGLVRVSVGLEDPDEIIEDFDRALRKRKR